jgi:2-polyprenyl-3-methyl-5-hydroxy-6-metoxy-1,4-benzoquinol methylase
VTSAADVARDGQQALTPAEEEIAELSEQSRRYSEAAPRAVADSGSSLSIVLAHVGPGKRVLELGTSTGYMTEQLVANGCTVVGVELDPGAAAVAAAHCETMIVGDLDDPELLTQLGDDHFDVVVAADVLEHLKDPLSALRRAVGYLSEGGAVVVSLPNITHFSARIALLQGRFPYTVTGLLDHTHLQFFDRRRVYDLFEQAGLGVVHIQPIEAGESEWSVPFEHDARAGWVLAETAGDPDARIFQFIVVGCPLPIAAAATVHQQLREIAALTTEVGRLEQQVDALSDQLSVALRNEAELRALLLSAHEQLAERDAAQIEPLRPAYAELEAELEREREARVYFELDSQAIHDRLERVTGSRAWRTVALLRRLTGRG